MISLSITIPTFNRPDALARTVARLLPQLVEGVDLVVIDNHSPLPAADTLAPLLSRYPGVACSIVRNRVNIGGNANILRCFEHGVGDWLWTLGDDDTPGDDAVAEILAAIRAAPHAAHFNFCSTIQPRRSPFEVASVDDFLSRCDSLGNSFFISANVYQREAFAPYVATALNHTDTNIAQLVLLLAALTDGRVSCFSERLVVDWAVAEESQRWPHYFFLQFLEIVRVLPDYPRQRKMLRLLDFASKQFAPLETLRWAVLSQYNHPENPSALLFTARNAHLRALLSTLSVERLRWHFIGTSAAFLHRNQTAALTLWSLWHQLRHGKKLEPMPYPYAYRGNFLHPIRRGLIKGAQK